MVVQPKAVLWPTDFSDLALHGARYARAFCELFQARLHVVHVVAPPLGATAAADLPIDLPTAYSEDAAVSACQDLLSRLLAAEFAGLPEIAHEICVGNPWSVICEYAGSHAIDLIIISTHGRTGLPHVLIGSTAERIVRHAPCPVLVVKDFEQGFVAEQ